MKLVTLPRGERLMLMFSTAPTHDEALELRGRAVFKTLNDLKLYTVTEPEENGSMEVGSGILFMDCNNLDNIPLVEDLRRSSRITLIVDVHFPLMGNGTIMALQTNTAATGRSEEKDEQARKYWRDPENLNRALALIRSADAVTCPSDRWAKGLRDYNSKVYVVPDVTDAKSAGKFFQAWTVAMWRARGLPTKWRWRDRILARMLRSSFQEHIKEIEE